MLDQDVSRIRFILFDGGGDGRGQNPHAVGDELPHGDWHQVTATVDGQTMRLYVAGELVATQAAIALDNSATPIFWGKWPGFERFCDLYLDDIALYNRPLSALEVRELQMTGPNVNDPSLVGYWANDRSNAGALTDAKGNGHATLQRGATLVDQCPPH